MEEKKIATSVDLLINVDRFEHLQITKYSEKKITYESQEEMIQKEDQLTDELVKDMIRTMRSMPNKLSKVSTEKLEKITTSITAIEDKISKKIPAWLEEGIEPNIANKAKENAVKAVATSHAKSEEAKANDDDRKKETEDFLESVYKTEEKPKVEEKDDIVLDENLFDDEDLFK